jgi:hypothetical protein
MGMSYHLRQLQMNIPPANLLFHAGNHTTTTTTTTSTNHYLPIESMVKTTAATFGNNNNNNNNNNKKKKKTNNSFSEPEHDQEPSFCDQILAHDVIVQKSDQAIYGMPMYMSGRLLHPEFCENMVIQTFYNPTIHIILRQLIRGPQTLLLADSIYCKRIICKYINS